MKKISKSARDTQKIAKNFAGKIVRHRAPNFNKAAVVGLSGELGSGKTTFAQGLAKAFRVKQKIISPTFILMKKFQIPKTKLQTNSKFQIQKFKTLIHIDAYRIKNPKEILDLGWEEMIKNPENIILVEWPEKIKKIFPKKYFWLNFSHLAPQKRRVRFATVKSSASDKLVSSDKLVLCKK